MKYKAWEAEDCYTLLKALEFRLSPIGYHIAMIGGVRPKRPELELVVFPNVKTEDIEHVRSLLHATEMQLRGIDELERPRMFGQERLYAVSRYEHGRGKNTRSVLVYFQEAPYETSEMPSLDT